jgi:hypothetical protein
MTARQILSRIAGEGDRAQRGGGGGTGLGSFRLDTIPSQPFYIARAFAPSTASRSPSAVSLRFTVEDFR